MRQPPKSIGLVACLCVLGLQLTGLHLHVGAEGFDPVPHGTHVHGVAHRHAADTAHAADAAIHDGTSHDPTKDHDDHAGDRDVAAVELGTSVAKAKTPVFLLADALEVVASAPVLSAVREDEITRPPSRHIRWRPPLRGPPRLSV